MSNHAGSHLLNGTLEIFYKYDAFTLIGEEKTQKLISEILSLSNVYDCNYGEILEDIGEKLGFCYCCGNKADVLERGLCVECR